VGGRGERVGAVTLWGTPVLPGDHRICHKGLERFFATGDKSGIQAKHADRLRLILGRLNVAASAKDMNLPDLDLHELRGPRKGTWTVRVSGNWRVTFICDAKDVGRVDYENYH
jgi:proteic killer suppression protein